MSWDTLLPSSVTVRLFIMGHWAITAQTDHVILWPWPLTLDVMAPALMQVVVLHPCTKFEVRRPWHSSDMAHDVSQCVSIILMGLVTLTFDLLTLKLVCKSHLRWGTFVPNLGTLFWFLDLFVMYATDGQTDGQKQRLLPPSLRYKGHNNSVSF